MEEVWKRIGGFVKSSSRIVRDSLGRIRNIREKVLRLTPNADGYLQVTLFNNSGGPCTKKVHQLVARSFIRLPGKNEQVRHYDGDKENNRVDNLLYGTAKDNYADMVRHGRTVFQRCPKNRAVGSKHYCSKLKESDVLKIKEMLKSGLLTNKQIGKAFGVNDRTISNIKLGKNWKHVGREDVLI